MRNVWGIKAIFMAFWSTFSHKKDLLERILYTSCYSITQELLQRLPEFGFSYLFLLFFDRHPQLVCERVKELNYSAIHTKRTCLARPVVCLSRALTTFENAMFLSYLRMTRWFSPNSSIFSTTLPTGWHRLKMSEMYVTYIN